MKFSKLQAAGNDFILIDGIERKITNPEEIAKKVCDRHFGIGADGMMYCEESQIADIKMNYYNSDGSRGAMCGNGIRCFSKFVYENGIVKKDIFDVETDAGIKKIVLTLKENQVEFVTVEMGAINFSASAVPCLISNDEVLEQNLELNGENIEINSVLMGVPHTVVFVENYENCDVNGLGREIEKHTLFPVGTNVNFIKVLDDENILIKTWERGAGRTLGCGTGCCSAGAIAHRLGKIKSQEVKLITEGGEVFITIGEGYNIKMRGDAQRICDGVFFL